MTICFYAFQPSRGIWSTFKEIFFYSILRKLFFKHFDKYFVYFQKVFSTLQGRSDIKFLRGRIFSPKKRELSTHWPMFGNPVHPQSVISVYISLSDVFNSHSICRTFLISWHYKSRETPVFRLSCSSEVKKESKHKVKSEKNTKWKVATAFLGLLWT